MQLLEDRITSVQASAESEDQRRLAATLLDYVRSPRTRIISERHGPIERLARWWQARRDRLFGRRGAKWVYGATLTLTGIRARITVAALVTGIVSVVSGARTSSTGIETVQLFVEGLAGALLVPGILLIALGRARQGLRLASLSLGLALLVQDTIGHQVPTIARHAAIHIKGWPGPQPAPINRSKFVRGRLLCRGSPIHRLLRDKNSRFGASCHLVA